MTAASKAGQADNDGAGLIARDLSLPALQAEIAALAERWQLAAGARERALDLGSEVGELQKEVLAATARGTAPFQATDAFREEFGDVLFALLALAGQADIDASAALNDSLRKYAARFDAKGSVASG